MGLDIYLKIQKKTEYLTKEEKENLDTFDRYLKTACRKNSNLADKLRRIYKEDMDYNLFYQTRTHKYMKKLYAARDGIYSKNKDCKRIWLNTDYDLYELFNQLNKTYIDDKFELSGEELKKIYDDYNKHYKKMLNNGQDENTVEIGTIVQNLNWINSILKKASDKHVIEFSCWY